MVITEVISEYDLKALARFSPDDNLVVSLYLDVDGAKYPRRQDCEKVLHSLINQATQDWIDGGYIEEKEKRKSLERDLGLVRDYVTGRWERNGTKGLAIFSSADERFWQVYELPISVPSALIVGEEPYARTLTALLNKYERFCVISVDRKKSRLFTVYLGAIEEEQGVFIDEWVPDQVKAGEWSGWRQSRIERHIDDHVMHHLKTVAGAAYDFFLERGCDHLILAGHTEILPKFQKMLHPYLRERLAGEFFLDPRAPAKEFLERSLRVEHEVRVVREEALVRQLREETAPGGLGAVGLDETLAALVRGQVYALLITEGYMERGAVCYTDHYLSIQRGSCPVCEKPLSETDDIIEDMVQLAINQNVKIEYISTQSPFTEHDKVGALLRYGQSSVAS